MSARDVKIIFNVWKFLQLHSLLVMERALYIVFFRSIDYTLWAKKRKTYVLIY